MTATPPRSVGARRPAVRRHPRVHEEGPSDGRPIVFLHGFLTNARLWRDVLPPLAASGYRCIAPDWPLGSHTTPMRPDADAAPWSLAALIAELLEALDLEDVVLVGNDTGGALAQMVVARHAERLGALVLTPCDAFKNWPAWWSKPLRPVGRSDRLMWLLGQPLRFRAVQRLPLVYGWVCKRHPPREVWRSWIEPGLRDPAIRRDFGKAFGATHSVADARGGACAAVVRTPGDGRVVHRARPGSTRRAHARRLAAVAGRAARSGWKTPTSTSPRTSPRGWPG